MLSSSKGGRGVDGEDCGVDDDEKGIFSQVQVMTWLSDWTAVTVGIEEG